MAMEVSAAQLNEAYTDDEPAFEFEPKYQLVNGIPNLKEGDVWAEKFKVIERFGWADKFGASYFVVELEKEDVELVLRIDTNRRGNTLNTEAMALKKTETGGHRLHFGQIHSTGLESDFCYLVSYFRGGPRLKDCVDFVKEHKFTYGSVGRFAYDLFKIAESLHSLGFALTCLNTDMVTFDACSRNLFLSDMSQIKCYNPELSIWRGGPHYAPLNWHKQEDTCLSLGDELMAIFFMVCELTMGELPWTGVHFDEIAALKQEFMTEKNLLNNLPPQYGAMFNLISDYAEKKEFDAAVYDELKRVSKEVYEIIGGVKDLDDNFDFEREPTAEELPRFVLEKRPIEESAEPEATGEEEAKNSEELHR
uniref:Protein kinase domain-containing protein n=1 Tax=Steinernema glaseri TaxID=37863 RepID=A0A1I7Z4H9_9BILA